MIAVWDDTDQWHAAAEAAFGVLLNQRCRLVATPQILYECGNASSRRTNRSDVCDLRKALTRDDLLIEPTDADVEIAWAAFELGDAAQAGIVDHVSFTVKRRLGISEAFANDRHFVAAGFSVLF